MRLRNKSKPVQRSVAALLWQPAHYSPCPRAFPQCLLRRLHRRAGLHQRGQVPAQRLQARVSQPAMGGGCQLPGWHRAPGGGATAVTPAFPPNHLTPRPVFSATQPPAGPSGLLPSDLKREEKAGEEEENARAGRQHSLQCSAPVRLGAFPAPPAPPNIDDMSYRIRGSTFWPDCTCLL